MIPLEQQVCSLELAKQLKELGVKQESLFNWIFVNRPGEIGKWRVAYDWDPLYVDSGNISAFTVAELGEMLPANYCSGRWENGYWWCHDSYDRNFDKVQQGLTEADARAATLVYMIKNKKISL